MPTLRPGDIVVMDNLSSHKGAVIRRAKRAAGAKLFFLPPYSPDLNPIEQTFAKLKLFCAKPANVPSPQPGNASAPCSTNCHQQSAPTTSETQDT